jgi:uncharacterized membrane protein YgcG
MSAPTEPAAAASSTNKILGGCLGVIVLLILWKLPATHDLMGFFLLMGFLTVGLTTAFFVVRWIWRSGWFGRGRRRGGYGSYDGGSGGSGDGGGSSGGSDLGGGGGFDAGGGGSDW